MANGILKTYGNLEDAPDNRMVVRVLGYALGTCDGWGHCGGHAVFLGDLQPTAKFADRHPAAAVAFLASDKPMKGLIIDYYTGRMAVVSHGMPESDDEADVLWEGPLNGQG